MKRWLPFPLFSVSLLCMWLVLNGELSALHVLAGSLLGIVGSLVLARLQAPLDGIRRRASTVAALFWLVFLDIVRSNIAVGRIAFHPGVRGRTAGFLDLPLEVRHPGGLAILACIIVDWSFRQLLLVPLPLGPLAPFIW